MKEKLILSSLPLQIAIFHHYYFDCATIIFEFILLIYKVINFSDFSKNGRDWSIVILVFWFLIELTRLRAISCGNKGEEIIPLTVSLALVAPVICTHIYLIKWQDHTFEFESITNFISLILIGVEIIFSVLLLWKLQFYKSKL